MISLAYEELPSTLQPYQRADALRLRASLETGTTVRAGALYWKSNGNPVPVHVFRDAYVLIPDRQESAAEAHTQAFLAEYRKSRSNRTLGAEERYEMRAAFGADAEVVDIITGQKFRT